MRLTNGPGRGIIKLERTARCYVDRQPFGDPDGPEEDLINIKGGPKDGVRSRV